MRKNTTPSRWQAGAYVAKIVWTVDSIGCYAVTRNYLDSCLTACQFSAISDAIIKSFPILRATCGSHFIDIVSIVINGELTCLFITIDTEIKSLILNRPYTDKTLDIISKSNPRCPTFLARLISRFKNALNTLRFMIAPTQRYAKHETLETDSTPCDGISIV